MLFKLVEAFPHGAVSCIANGALRLVTGEGVPAPRVALWEPVPGGLQTSAETPDAVTGLTPGARKVLAVLAKLGTPEEPVRLEELASQLPGHVHLEADLSAFVHPSRTRPLVVQRGERFHATEVALQLLRGECVLPLLLLNGFEGATTRVPAHPIAETIDVVLQRLELTGFTYAPNLVPDPRAFGVISRETVTSYLATGSGVVHWRARVVIEPERAVLISDLTWPLGPAEVAERIEYVHGALGRLVGLCNVELVGSSSVRVEVEHAHLALGVWWELLSSGLVGRTWPVNLLVHDGEVVRRMTAVELIDAFVDRSLEALKANPEPPPVQLAWERAHAQEGVCVALRALDEVLVALARPDAQQVLTHFPLPVLSAAARTLPARTPNDYSRGFSQAQAAHLIGLSDLGSRNLADEDDRWLRLRAELELERTHPRSTTPRARLRRQLLELRARFAEPRLT